LQADGRAEHAAEIADVLAEHDDAAIPLHLHAEAVVDGLDEVHLGHVIDPSKAARPRASGTGL